MLCVIAAVLLTDDPIDGMVRSQRLHHTYAQRTAKQAGSWPVRACTFLTRGDKEVRAVPA